MDTPPANNTASQNTAPPTVPAPPPTSNPPSVQQMRQGNADLERQRQLLHQKLAERANGNFTSPTDQMMTPVSKKLSDHKKKAFGKSKPVSLASRFSKAAAEEKPKTENKPISRFAKPSVFPEGAAPDVDPFAK
ncbi:hypothetical protein EX30DRAFT_371782 [Ascodesmis nigricans]|uniref:Uncharacterized protein n=1 Tax=Ascodesmis nigricans TaxID=341454 RepID=A0A4S2MWU7_9PEZI|nr:hypothetical protein EX30DRAFT_371782 [Ascodesmis nigricans]